MRKTLLATIKKNKRWLILGAIFLVFVFLRFYQIDSKSMFLVDQLDSAWASKRIIADHNFPLVGPANKLGSGIYVGPLYYYLISIFYFFTNLDPIAAMWFAGFSSIIAFFTIFFVTKKLFSFNTAIIAVLINTFSYSGIQFDRVQWEINFIPIVGLLAFYFLHQTLQGKEKSILWLSIAIALAFHTHLTIAVYLPIITILSSPFFPKTKKTLKYILLSLPIMLFGLSPMIIANIQNGGFLEQNATKYAGSMFHGIHLQRIIQLAGGAFYQIDPFLKPFGSSNLKYLIPIFFAIIYLKNKLSIKKLKFLLLISLFYLVPWVVLSTYAGEVTDYYFSTNRYIGLFVIAYLISKIIMQKKLLLNIGVLIFFFYYTLTNLQSFFKYRTMGLDIRKKAVIETIKEGKKIPFNHESTESYIYYVLTRSNKQ